MLSERRIRRRRVAAAAGRRREAPARPESAPRVIVLAGGIGAQMRSAVPKVLHRVGGRTLLEAVLRAAQGVNPSRVVVALGPGGEPIREAFVGQAVSFHGPLPSPGAGHALRGALDSLGPEDGPTLVLRGDMPLLRPETFVSLVERRRRRGLDLAFLSFRPPDPGEFGRVLRDARGRVRRVVDGERASARDRKIAEVSAGVYCFAQGTLERVLEAGKSGRDPEGPRLAAAVETLVRSGGRVEAVLAADWREAWTVQTRRDLAAAEEIEHRRRIEGALDAGVTVVDPLTTRIGSRVTIEPDVVLHPFVCLEGDTSIGEGVEVLPFTRIVDSTLSSGTVVGPHCELEGARVGPRCRVGPFARLRPGSVLEDDVRIGNFVETKNTVLHSGVKALHLAYLGDAAVGANSNIGAGVITCNYDGLNKNHTEIGEGVFVGSDSQLVAPVTVGRGAYVGAGATITENVPEGALALSRVAQTNLEGWVEKRRKRLEARRAREAGEDGK